MRKIKNKIYLSFLIITILTLLFSLLHILEFYSLDKISHAQSGAKISSTAEVDDNFDGNSIIIVLNKQASLEFKTYTPQDFPEFNCSEVIDLTLYTSELVKKQLNTKQKTESYAIESKNENSIQIDIEKFRRILKLKINQSTMSKTSDYQDNGFLMKKEVLNVVDKISNRSDILYCGPNYIYESAALIPNDTEYIADKQWAINDIDLPKAWEITTGSDKVVVGVIDTGIEGNHNDLINNTNNNQHRDFRNANEVVVNNTFDTSYHGTHVAGIIGAETNNNNGIAGTCWDVDIVSLIISENGKWFADNAILAVDYATANNIKVLNYSGRVRDRNGNININDPAFEQAISVYPGLFVVSVGNDCCNNDLVKLFPSNYSNLDNIIAVGSIDSNGERSNFSNYGEKSVDIYAPGRNIYSTVPYSYNSTGYAYMSGTSMAAPHVTGVAALILSVTPDLSAAQLKQAIINGADDIAISTPDGEQNVKKLNAYKALLEIVKEDESGYYIEKIYQDYSMRDYISVNTISIRPDGSYDETDSGMGTIGGYNGISVSLCDMINGAADYTGWTIYESELVIYMQGIIYSGCYVYTESGSYVGECTYSTERKTLHVPIKNLLQTGEASFVLVPEITVNAGSWTVNYTVGFGPEDVYLNLYARIYI